MTRLAIAAVLTVLCFVAGYWTRGSVEARRAVAVAQEAREARQRADAAEAQRLTLQSERDRLAQELEDAAHAEPVSRPDALPASRVRRLQQIR